VDQQYLNLETYRKSGQAMRTPVWFTESQGQLYVRTIDNSGKVKRIRNHSNVRVIACDAQGNIKGEWMDATARLVTDPTEAERIEHLFDEKYGETKKHFDQQRKVQGLKYATIAISI
jgi:PPOX class probable F420-dependent enzyme